MSVDFRQLQEQVRKMGDQAAYWDASRREANENAAALLSEFSRDLDGLGQKLDRAIRFNPNLRCARPLTEPLDGFFSCPDTPANAVIIAADGSQINPDRHAQVDFSLINVGAIQMLHGTKEPPAELIFSDLLFDDLRNPSQAVLSEGLLALKRDLFERKVLLNLSQNAPGEPVITFTDGPIELWNRREPAFEAEFRAAFKDYIGVLSGLCRLGVATAGYVDRPGANYVVQLLEIGLISDDEIVNLRTVPPKLAGASDRRLYGKILPPGSRSAVFGLQAKSSDGYDGDLQLHFFYLNVGRAGSAKIARIEIPAWVAMNKLLLNSLHAVLIDQSRILGTNAYPYLLHRAHEAAVVTRSDKDQIIQMILLEWARRGLAMEDVSEKQRGKDLPGRTRYS